MAGWSSSTRRSELPSGWRRIRTQVMERDEWTCRICGLPATEVDHIRDPHDHGFDNLQALCHADHARKTAREAATARAKHSRRRPSEVHPGIIR